jgi:hypothetical protein
MSLLVGNTLLLIKNGSHARGNASFSIANSSHVLRDAPVSGSIGLQLGGGSSHLAGNSSNYSNNTSGT